MVRLTPGFSLGNDHVLSQTWKNPTHYNYDKESNLYVDWWKYEIRTRTVYTPANPRIGTTPPTRKEQRERRRESREMRLSCTSTT